MVTRSGPADERAHALAAALATIDTWDVPDAGAVVVDPHGPLATHGATTRVLPIASVAKPLTATAVLVDVASGALDLDEPVGPTAAEGATLRHLLAHAAGLDFDPGGRTMRPGVRRVYSNWGYELAAAHAAERAGVPFADLLRDRVLDPLGMHATVLDGSPAWAVRSTVEDLGRYVRALLDPTALGADVHALLTTPTFPALDGVLPGFGRQRPNGWTLALEVRGTKDPHWSGTLLSPRTVGHFGRSGSLVWADPERGIGLATLSGRDFGDWARTAWPALADAVVATVSGS